MDVVEARDGNGPPEGGTGRGAAPGPAGGAGAPTGRERLRALLERCGSVLVGYSGGVDSVYLAHEALTVLGPRRTLAVTGVGPALAARQHEVARTVAERFGIPWRTIETREMEEAGYVDNAPDRCYHCKTELYGRLARLAGRLGFETVADGTNADDADDYRPGVRAAREWGVRSPLQEAGLGKTEIRALSREAGLPTWEAPASPCLASRLPYGVAVTPERLRQVEEAEGILRALGVEGDFRVRHHAGVARLELPPGSIADWSEAALRRRAARDLAGIGFRRVVLDLEGYASGSLNRSLVSLRRPGTRPTRERSPADAVPGTGQATGRAGRVAAPSPAWEPAGPEGEIGVLRLGREAAGRLLGEEGRRRALAARAREGGFRYAALDLPPERPAGPPTGRTGRPAGLGVG